MKKIIITAIVLLTAHFSYAQVALGLSLGFSSSKAKVSYLQDDGYITLPVNGAPVSFIVDFGNKYVKFSTGLTFVKKGVLVRDEYGNGDYDQVSYNLSYVELPLTLKVYFNKSKLRFFAIGGAYFGYLGKGTEKEVYLDGTSKEKSSKEMDLEDYDLEGRIDAGIKTGFGLQYDFKYGSLFANPSFHIGFIDVDSHSDDHWVNRAMLLNVGYLYTFHKKTKK